MDLPNGNGENSLFTRSQVGSSRSQTSSTASHVLLKQRAKAEAAKIRLQYACQEAKLMQEELDAQVRRKLLISECELKEAEAELHVFENFEFEQISDTQSVNPKYELSKCLELQDPIPKDDLIKQYLSRNAIKTTVSDRGDELLPNQAVHLQPNATTVSDEHSPSQAVHLQQNVNNTARPNQTPQITKPVTPPSTVHRPASNASDSPNTRAPAYHNKIPALDIDAEEFVPRMYQPQMTPK